MNQHKVHLLDLPNEILFLILRQLENVDVLHSLIHINNQRLESIVQDQIFTNTLNFLPIIKSTGENSSISGSTLHRFCVDILPRIHENVRSLSIDSASMECILGAVNYPNLTQLKLINFNQAIISRYFTDDSVLVHNYKQQITKLILINNESNVEIAPQLYTKNVYTVILAFFENLKHLRIVVSYTKNFPEAIKNGPHLSLSELPPTIFSSSTLTKLCVYVNDLSDIYALLDGRLKQLSVLTVQVKYIHNPRSMSHNMDTLPNLKCFSLTCYRVDSAYDITVFPLLRRMSHLEELTLLLHISAISTFISGTHLNNEILIHMRQLHTFSFYIEYVKCSIDLDVRVSTEDIERTFTNTKYGQVACMTDYFNSDHMIYRIFSLPTKFHRLEEITNNIPNIIFNSVTHLKVQDTNGFKHEFFVRLARAFPLLKNLSISSILPPFWRHNQSYLRATDWCSMIEYLHLIFLDVRQANSYYVEHFLNETKTRLPSLTNLEVKYEDLGKVTEYFTKDEMRRNCSRVTQLLVESPIVYPENIYRYFPLL